MSGTKSVEVSFRLHSGPRTQTIAPQKSTIAQSPGRLPNVTRVLALAIHFQNMITCSDAKDYADVARLGGLCRERVSQIMRLLYLAPDIQVELLYLPPTGTGRYPVSETAVRKIANLLSWNDQRQEWVRLKEQHLLG
jgi:hypothetical protein